MNDRTEEGGGPAGVVEGFDARGLDSLNFPSLFCPAPGVDGAKGLEGAGIVKEDAIHNLRACGVDRPPYD